jgi:hypothetical protein
MFVYLYLLYPVLGRVPAAVTSKRSGVRINIQHPLRPFLTFTNADRYGRRRLEGKKDGLGTLLERTAVKDERGYRLAVRWAVWRWS